MAKGTGEPPKDETSDDGKPSRQERREDYVRRLEARERFYRDAYYRQRHYARRDWDQSYWNRRPSSWSDWWDRRRYDGRQQPPQPEPRRASNNRPWQDGPRHRLFQPRPIWERERLVFHLVVRLIIVVAVVRFLLDHFAW